MKFWILRWRLKKRLNSDASLKSADKAGRTSLNDWLSKAGSSAIGEIKSFTRGSAQNKWAVQAAVKYEWSRGQVERQVNPLKLIKRQMYGGASFDLLKAKVIHFDDRK